MVRETPANEVVVGLSFLIFSYVITVFPIQTNLTVYAARKKENIPFNVFSRVTFPFKCRKAISWRSRRLKKVTPQISKFMFNQKIFSYFSPCIYFSEKKNNLKKLLHINFKSRFSIQLLKCKKCMLHLCKVYKCYVVKKCVIKFYIFLNCCLEF